MNSSLEKLIMGVQFLALGGILCACGKGAENTDTQKEAAASIEIVSEASESDAEEDMEGGMSQGDEASEVREGGDAYGAGNGTAQEGGAYQVDGHTVIRENADESGMQEGGTPEGEEHNPHEGGGNQRENDGKAQEEGGSSDIDKAAVSAAVSQILNGDWEDGVETSVEAGSMGR